METALILIAVALAVAIGYVYKLYADARSSASASEALNTELRAASAQIQQELDGCRSELEKVRTELTAEKTKNASLVTQLELLEKRYAEMQQAAEERFKNIATEIMNRNSAMFKQQNEERLGEILSPLNE